MIRGVSFAPTELDDDFVRPISLEGDPAWEVALLFPIQGQWRHSDYFALDTNRFVELQDGRLEIHEPPTMHHQLVLQHILDELHGWNEVAQRGVVLHATLPLALFEGTIREPDILLVPYPPTGPLPRYPTSALFVIEVVSKGEKAHHRDYIEKRADYAKAGIPEYWIVDPVEKAVTVLRLDGAEYAVHGRFEQNQIATAATLEGFAVKCGEIWALEHQK